MRLLGRLGATLGLPRRDGGAPPEYAVEYDHNLPERIPAGTRFVGWLTFVNRGIRTWEPGIATDGTGPFEAVMRRDGELAGSFPIPRVVPPGESVTLHGWFRAPERPGRYEYTVEMVHHHVTWFAERGADPLRVAVEVTADAPTVSARLLDRSEAALALAWWTGIGVSWSRRGPGYPVIARSANGCRITDVEGRTFIDYVMGHGCALLGYANERIARAVAESLASAAVLSLTSELEVEVAERIRAMIPGAERVLFGKNGSDACTAAVRLARVHTLRPVVLFCGYHGWQDWFVERLGFAGTGVPGRAEPLVERFRYGDLEEVERLLARHRGRVAAVMVEPAAPIERYGEPLRDADPRFLASLAALTRSEGALLVFDELVTGFRYRDGSVQRATGVVPDLTCLGKGLAAGMPLSALGGRREIFDRSIGRIAYGPTYQGEGASLAAAREALAVYREVDVPAHLARFSGALATGIDRICGAFDLPARTSGPPFRMVVSFDDDDPVRRRLTRTLLQQELMRHGVLSNQGLLMPSLAHDDAALAQTLAAFERALGTVRDARRDGRFAGRLEISPAHE